jgi:hypothetical protein
MIVGGVLRSDDKVAVMVRVYVGFGVHVAVAANVAVEEGGIIVDVSVMGAGVKATWGEQAAEKRMMTSKRAGKRCIGIPLDNWMIVKRY